MIDHLKYPPYFSLEEYVRVFFKRECIQLSSYPIYSGFVLLNLQFSIVFNISLFILFFWPLFCQSFSDLRILMVILLSSTFRTIQVLTFAQWVPLETLQFSYSKPGRHDKTQEWPKVVLGKTNQSNILIIILLIYLYLEFCFACLFIRHRIAIIL